MKILLLDVETAPNLAYVFQFYNQNISIDKVEEIDYMLCWAAKWYGEDEMFESSIQHQNRKEMMIPLWNLLDEADAVVHFNGRKFDIPWINREFILSGLTPPSPYKEIDLVETARKRFRFPSNKLNFLLRVFGLGEKDDMEFEDWVGCIKGHAASWKKMIKYNIKDVLKLEELYVVMMPWIKGHANHGLYSDGSKHICPNCGSEHLHKRGFAYTLASKFQKYECQSCKHWSRGTKPLGKKEHKTVSIAV